MLGEGLIRAQCGTSLHCSVDRASANWAGWQQSGLFVLVYQRQVFTLRHEYQRRKVPSTTDMGKFQMHYEVKVSAFCSSQFRNFLTKGR